MIEKVLSALGLSKKNVTDTQDASRRKHVRYEAFHAEVVVGDRAYAIRDWGMGGVFFETTPDARLTAGDKIPTVLKFRFLHETITVQMPARIIRTAKRGIAAEFSSLPAEVRRQLERVRDNLHAQNFLESQIA